MGEKTFLLVPGGQKCGTAWLSNYVDAFDNVDMGEFKEYHVWDAYVLPGSSQFQTPLTKVLRTRNSRDALRWWLQLRADNYFSYFARRLARPAITMTGDITPSYSGLGADAFARIREGFEKRGIGVKVVFLMRDPYERCWSAVRHHKRHKQSRNGVDITLSDEEALLAYVRHETCHLRTNYHKTIGNLEKAFDSAAIHYGIFEEIFTQKGLEPLSAFLHVPCVVERTEETYNTTIKQQQITETAMRIAVNEFRDVYAFCAERFPQTRELWPGFRYLD